MASAAFIVDGMVFTIPAIVKGWGTSFLVIVLTSIAIPAKMQGDKLALAFKLKINTLPFRNVCNDPATEDICHYTFEQMEWLLNDAFGMSMDEVYALPIK